jgi:hypothetical protein
MVVGVVRPVDLPENAVEKETVQDIGHHFSRHKSGEDEQQKSEEHRHNGEIGLGGSPNIRCATPRCKPLLVSQER